MQNCISGFIKICIHCKISRLDRALDIICTILASTATKENLVAHCYT